MKNWLWWGVNVARIAHAGVLSLVVAAFATAGAAVAAGSASAPVAASLAVTGTSDAVILPVPDFKASNDRPIPRITMYQKDKDKPCFFSLYDGGKIDFTQSSQCPNDQHYYFQIEYAHEGMVIEFHDAPSCNGSEPYVKYKVTLLPGEGDTGTIPSPTSIVAGDGIQPGHPVLDAEGKPRLQMVERKAGTLEGKISCVRVSMLLPNGPFQFDEGRCLEGPLSDNSQRLRTWVCSSTQVKQRFFEINDGTRSLYAAWIARTPDYVPYAGHGAGPNYIAEIIPTAPASNRFHYAADSKLKTPSGRCMAISEDGMTLVGAPCTGSGVLTWQRMLIPPSR